MRTILVILMISIPSFLFATSWIIGGGMVFGDLSGWNLSTGLVDNSYSVEAGLNFDIGKTIEGSSVNLYNFEFLAKIPLYRIDGFQLGPSVALKYGNYPIDQSSTDTTIKSGFSAGFYGSYRLENLLFDFGFLYPVIDEFDFVHSLYASVKFFVNPPEKGFIDQLFIGCDFLLGRIRIMVGLIEPF